MCKGAMLVCLCVPRSSVVSVGWCILVFGDGLGWDVCMWGAVCCKCRLVCFDVLTNVSVCVRGAVLLWVVLGV